MRRPLLIGLVVGIAMVPAASAFAQYPPPSGCTAEEREAFNRQQREETKGFKDRQRQERQLFRETGPHSAAERRTFNRIQRDELNAFREARRDRREHFLDKCKARLLTDRGSTETGVTIVPPPAITVGHMILALALLVSALILRSRLRRMPSREPRLSAPRLDP
jgi:hypothetical protein